MSAIDWYLQLGLNKRLIIIGAVQERDAIDKRLIATFLLTWYVHLIRSVGLPYKHL